MSATPIPRTLALSIYGDLDISRLKQKPKGRKKIITKLVSGGKEEETYEFIRKEIEKGRQAFVICPLIEDSEKMEVKSVINEHEKLSRKIFSDIPIGILHGKMKAEEKDAAMGSFLKKETMILVSTSVIEVGVDVPNATIMIIESAERFGLSQIHQFRGRVGRSSLQSYCFLFSEEKGEVSKERLRTVEKISDGFELAEADLKFRGPGEFSGTKQSGTPDMVMASLTDYNLVKLARKWAQATLELSPDLKSFPALQKALKSYMVKVHME
jgi:ATP-dependent DNA helicase RecG